MPEDRFSLYLITDRGAFRGAECPDGTDRQIEAIRLAAAAGCPMVQVREKDLGGSALLELTRRAVAAASPHGCRVLVNDRLDVAVAAGAAGVHLRVDSIPCRAARQAADGLGLRGFLIGVSTHSLGEVMAARDGGADFVVCGPVFETPSKPGYGPPLGIEKLGEVCRRAGLPVIALGGINLANYRQALDAGASGIGGIGLFSNPAAIEGNVRRILGSTDQ